MNKAELIEAIHKELAVSKAAIADVLEAQGHVITQHLALAEDQGIESEAVLPGLGKFKTGYREARTGRNPQTGETVQIDGRVTVKFVAGKQLKAALNPERS